ncbi:hypothetical protein PF003_g12042 [Phytophthora fragariae]|nr:hypothetical protein PF003_g12042 [Phytophthora fragariae]
MAALIFCGTGPGKAWRLADRLGCVNNSHPGSSSWAARDEPMPLSR